MLIGLFSIYSGDLKPAVGPSKMQWQGDEHSKHARKSSPCAGPQSRKNLLTGQDWLY